MQAVLIGERITGKGVVQALDHAVGVPLWEIEPLLGLLVLSLLWGALYPRKQLVPQAEGAQAMNRNWIADAQVLVRKLACIALAVAIVAETISGKVQLAWAPSFLVASGGYAWFSPWRVSLQTPCLRDPYCPVACMLQSILHRQESKHLTRLGDCCAGRAGSSGH